MPSNFSKSSSSSLSRPLPCLALYTINPDEKTLLATSSATRSQLSRVGRSNRSAWSIRVESDGLAALAVVGGAVESWFVLVVGSGNGSGRGHWHILSALGPGRRSLGSVTRLVLT